MKKCFGYLLLLCGCVVCLAGCEKEDAGAKPREQPASPADWKQEGFAVSGAVEEEQEFWVREFIPWGHEEVVIDPETEELSDRFLLEAGTLDGKVYRLNAVTTDSFLDVNRWILEIYDTTDMRATVREFTPGELGQEEGMICFLADMDLVDPENFVFQWVEMERSGEGMIHWTADRMLYSSLRGDVTATDLWNACVEKGILQEEYTEYILLPSGHCVCDGEGNIYIKAGQTDYGYNRLAVFDREGSLLLEYQGSPEQALEEPLRTESGEMIYPVYDMRQRRYDFLWADVQNREMKLLASFDSVRCIRQMYGMRGNDIYYEVSEGIVKWDIASGRRTLLFSYRENGIGSGYETGYQTMLVFREGQPPLLRLYRALRDEPPEDWLAPLSGEAVTREEAVRVVDLTGGGMGSSQVAECAAYASRRDLNREYTYKSAPQGQMAEEFRTRVMAELTAGEGPDILYVSRADMKILHDAGVLLDLRELIPEETLEDLLPGVIGLGTLDGELAGMAGGCHAVGLAVSGDVWEGETWTLEDFTSLVEEGMLEGGIYYPGMETYYAPFATARSFTERTLGNSFLIDWENGECHFEDERYIRFLEAVRIDRESLDVMPRTWLKGGKRAANFTIASESGICDVGSFMESEGGRYVGFPTEGEAGNYLSAWGVIAVNANTGKTEAVLAFLESFLGEKIQDLNRNLFNPSLSVRKLSLDEIEQDEEGKYFWHGEEVTVFEDGTTSIHRAKEFLESCVAEPMVDPGLSRILYEELEALYLDPARNPGDVADIIDRRVQTYLNEMN